MNNALAVDADAVADVQAVAVGDETRMDLAVDHQHRPGLRRVPGFHAGREIGGRFHHAGLLAVGVKDAVRQQVKIPPAGLGADLLPLDAVFDIKADRRQVVVIHAGIHGKMHRGPVDGNIVQHCAKTAIRPAGIIAVIEPDLAPGGIEAADRIGLAEMHHAAACFTGHGDMT